MDTKPHGNKRADKAAKNSLLTHVFSTKIPCTDLKPTIKKFIYEKWQKSWDDQIHKFHHVQDTIDSVASRLQKKQKRSDTFLTWHWPHLHYLLIPPKKGRYPNILNVQSTLHSQTHSLKL